MEEEDPDREGDAGGLEIRGGDVINGMCSDGMNGFDGLSEL